MTRTLIDVEKAVGPEAFLKRVAAADLESVEMEAVLQRIESGLSRSAAVRAIFPGKEVASMLRRLRVYEAQGRDGLISRRHWPEPTRKMTAEVRGGLRVLAMSMPKAGSVELSQQLEEMFGESFGATIVQVALRELGLARPRGKRRKRLQEEEGAEAEVVEVLALAGAELLVAVDESCGAVAGLTSHMGERLKALEPPEGDVLDDSGNRDERGRFLSGYNTPGPRTEPELGHRFNGVEERRAQKDLTSMRIVKESEATRHRKNLGLVLLPCVVKGARWSAIEHWRGGQLGELIGYSYQASTLDKYLRELKLSGCAHQAREGVASFWLEHEGASVDCATGAVVLYADASLKPLWTRHWTRSAKVSQTGRIQPAVTTMTLHTGGGTPVLFRSYSGYASLSAEIPTFLRDYERHAGEGTVRRVIVMDREAHTVALFKELDPKWGFVVPLRSNVVGPKAEFSGLGEWSPYGDTLDKVRDAELKLNDSRPGEAPLMTRVVGRLRSRTGKVAWFATNLSIEEFPASEIVRLYFRRWPAQEHVYRDGNGAVGLNVHHGYGKVKIDNVAVLDEIERTEGQLRRLDEKLLKKRAEREAALAQQSNYQAALDSSAPKILAMGEAFRDALSAGEPASTLEDQYHSLSAWEDWITRTRDKLDGFRSTLQRADTAIATMEARRETKKQRGVLLASRRRIFTVDVELDEIMTCFKLTFMNLSKLLMHDYLDKVMELDTLIEAVLTLPGERVTTSAEVIIRIYRQDRDKAVMAAVKRACLKLSTLGLKRGDRTLRFELADAKTPTARSQ